MNLPPGARGGQQIGQQHVPHRNDADLRAGLRYLSIGEEIRRPLKDLDPPDDTGVLTGTRLFVRPGP